MPEKRILIIDDDEDILETTGALLKHEGFAIFCANTVERGIEMLTDVKPGLIPPLKETVAFCNHFQGQCF